MKTPALVTAMLATVVFAVSPVYDDDADAARRPLLKTLWAVIREDGTHDRGKDVADLVRLAEGAYRITFNRNSATVDLSGPGEGRVVGEVYVSKDDDCPGDPTTPRRVDVVTFDSSGTTQVDKQFGPIVNC